jgi:putative efflux protein, MATE family
MIKRNRSFFKNLIMLAIPISLQNLITFAMGFADNVMVRGFGSEAISGVYMGNQPQIVLQMFVGGIEGAVLILAAQYWGKKDTARIKKIVSIGLQVAFGVGLIVSLVTVLMPTQIIFALTKDPNVVKIGSEYLRIVGISYLFFCVTQVLIASMRSVETAFIGMYISIMALVTNVMLNYIFIFGIKPIGFPAFGVKGAAIATLISRILEMIVVLIYVLRVDKKLKMKFKEFFVVDKVLLKDFLKYGLPIIGGNLVWSINMIGNSMILGSYDNKHVIAAVSIAGSLHSLIYVWMNGLSSSVGVITGKTVGAGLYEKMKEYAKIVQVMFLCVGIISGIFIFLSGNFFISMFKPEPEAQEYARQFVGVISITIIGTCYQAACLFGLVKSGGDISFVFKMDTIAVIGVLTISYFAAFVFKADPWVVFACLKCDQILKCIVAVIKINSFNWMKNLTRKDESYSKNATT